MTKQIKSENLEGCFRKGLEVTHYTTLKDGTKPCCKTCPGTKEYAEKNEAKCYITKHEYFKIMCKNN